MDTPGPLRRCHRVHRGTTRIKRSIFSPPSDSLPGKQEQGGGFSAEICIIRHNFTYVRLRQDPWRGDTFITDLLFFFFFFRQNEFKKIK